MQATRRSPCRKGLAAAKWATDFVLWCCHWSKDQTAFTWRHVAIASLCNLCSQWSRWVFFTDVAAKIQIKNQFDEPFVWGRISFSRFTRCPLLLCILSVKSKLSSLLLKASKRKMIIYNFKWIKNASFRMLMLTTLMAKFSLNVHLSARLCFHFWFLSFVLFLTSWRKIAHVCTLANRSSDS